MNGGYVCLNSKLLADIVSNSENVGAHEFKNCYDIALEAISTKKIIFGNAEIGAFYICGMYIESNGTIVFILYGDKAVICSFSSSDKNHYTIGG